MTEEEMKKTWCPHVRTGFVRKDENENTLFVPRSYSGNVLVYSTGGKVFDRPNCIGKKCSQWRWDQAIKQLVWDEKENDYVDAEKDTRKHGYCGLAGRP